MYLLENTSEAEALRENVRQLLASETLENVALALQIIKGGGMHPSFVFYLWAVYYNMPKATKKTIKKYIEQTLPQLSENPNNALVLSSLETYFSQEVIDMQKIATKTYPEDCSLERFLLCIFSKIVHKQTYFDEYFGAVPSLRRFMLEQKCEWDKTQLYLDGTKLTELPAEVGEILTLKRLSIRSSHINTLPETFFNLNNLAYFDYEDSPLKENKAIQKKLKKTLPLLEATQHFDRGMTRYYDQKYALAVKSMQKATQLCPDNFEFLKWLAEACRMADMKSEALAGFEKANDVRPHDAFIWAKLAELRCNFKQYEKALEMCETYLQNPQIFNDSHHSAESDILFVQGLTFFWLKRYDESIVSYKKAVAIDNYAGGWYNLACSYSKKGMKDEMLKHLTKAFELDWDDYYMFCVEDEDRDFDGYYEDADFRALLEKFDFKKKKKGK